MLIHPSAFVSGWTRLGAGTVLMPRVVVNADAIIGRDCILNTGAIVEHDCHIGDHVHIAPGVILGGGVRIEPSSLLGLGLSRYPAQDWRSRHCRGRRSRVGGCSLRRDCHWCPRKGFI